MFGVLCTAVGHIWGKSVRNEVFKGDQFIDDYTNYHCMKYHLCHSQAAKAALIY